MKKVILAVALSTVIITPDPALVLSKSWSSGYDNQSLVKLAETGFDKSIFVSQGMNLSACGPSSAAMMERWATGRMTNRFQTRAVFPNGTGGIFKWWNIRLVHLYLQQAGVNSRYAPVQIVSGRTLGVYHVDGNHIVTAQSVNGVMKVYDSLGGMYSESIQSFRSRITFKYMVQVERNG